MRSISFCCIGVFEALFLHANRLKVEYSKVLEERLLINVFNAEIVQLVKESFLGLIYFLRLDVFHSFTACS